MFSGRKNRHIGRNIVLIFLALILGCGVYTAVDNGRVTVKKQRVLVAGLPSALEGFTVLHISDLNGHRFGPNQRQLASVLKDKKYSAVIITGDMVGKGGDPYPFYELLSALDTSKPVFFIAGDSDPAPVGGHASGYYTVLADWVTGAQSRGAIFLDAPASMTVGAHRVWFSDAEQLTLDLDTAERAYESSSASESAFYLDSIIRTKEARAQMRDTDLHIALSHAPVGQETVLSIQHAANESENTFLRTVDLIASGGTVGGQWKLPFVGPVWSDGWFPKGKIAGYYEVGGGRLLQYTSGGLGTSGKNPMPDFRLFNTPEVTLLTFTAEMDDDSLP